MKAIAKISRILTNGEERRIEALPLKPYAIAELCEGEKILVKLWHGACLESQVEVYGDPSGRVYVKLIDKKELHADGPKEAL